MHWLHRGTTRQDAYGDDEHAGGSRPPRSAERIVHDELNGRIERCRGLSGLPGRQTACPARTSPASRISLLTFSEHRLPACSQVCFATSPKMASREHKVATPGSAQSRGRGEGEHPRMDRASDEHESGARECRRHLLASVEVPISHLQRASRLARTSPIPAHSHYSHWPVPHALAAALIYPFAEARSSPGGPIHSQAGR